MSEGSIIGTLGEGAVHSYIKDYIEPDRAKQEIDYLGFVADIKNEEGITEVQTSSFERLSDKLTAFLENDRVTVVFPAISEKQLVTLDKSGEVLSIRKSPKSVKPISACTELYKIRDFLKNPALTVKIFALSCIEYKTLGKNERGKMKRRSVSKLIGITELKEVADYKALLLPPDMPNEFFAAEYINKSRLKDRPAYAALGVLVALGIIEKGEKRGRAHIYKTVN